jgi:hypothetical protein
VVGASSTQPGITGDTLTHTGTDTLRLLFGVETVPGQRFSIDLDEPWVVDPLPAFGMVAVEGNPVGGGLWTPAEVLSRGAAVKEFIADNLGSADERGVSRQDVTTSRRYDPSLGQAFMAGMAAIELPRMEATRRGTPPHSVWWTGQRSARINARVYDEAFKVEGRESFERIRLEDQRRYPAARRIALDVAADPDYQRGRFMRRFEPMRRAVDGVTAASFPVIAQALADEVKYGYRSYTEAERLAGSLVLFGAGVRPSKGQSTLYRRRSELRAAGYVVVENFMDPVEVNLGDELEETLAGFGQ